MRKEDVDEFVSYVKDNLVGDEKGQAQLFCDRLFRAFGHKGIFEADGNLEVRVKESETEKTKFIDCLWSPAKRWSLDRNEEKRHQELGVSFSTGSRLLDELSSIKGYRPWMQETTLYCPLQF